MKFEIYGIGIGRGLNPWPPFLMNVALPTELPRPHTQAGGEHPCPDLPSTWLLWEDLDRWAERKTCQTPSCFMGPDGQSGDQLEQDKQRLWDVSPSTRRFLLLSDMLIQQHTTSFLPYTWSKHQWKRRLIPRVVECRDTWRRMPPWNTLFQTTTPTRTTLQRTWIYL